MLCPVESATKLSKQKVWLKRRHKDRGVHDGLTYAWFNFRKHDDGLPIDWRPAAAVRRKGNLKTVKTLTALAHGPAHLIAQNASTEGVLTFWTATPV